MTGTHYDAAGAALAKGRTSEFLHKLQLLAANKHRDFDCVRFPAGKFFMESGFIADIRWPLPLGSDVD